MIVGLAGALAAPQDHAGVSLELFAENFTSPTVMVPLADGSGRFLVADQVGTIHVLSADGQVSEKLFLDLRPKLRALNQGFDERGILGVALHPDFGNNRKFYVYYSAPLRESAPEDWDHTSRIAEFKTLPDNPALADPGSERILLEIDQPYFNHNSGRLLFGPDGYLYIASGDGGNANDTGKGHSEIGNGQDLTTLLGKILRIDVNRDQGYAIPPDNPFVDGKPEGARPEIYAYGLRNPWGISFDRGGTHDFFAADVGQTMFEEVNIIIKGGNYGWNIREGFHCFDPNDPKTPPSDCPKVGAHGKPLLDPIVEYKNINGFRRDPEALGISVTGGYVYRGKALPDLQGRYVFADWSRNWALPDAVLLSAIPPDQTDSKSWKLEPLRIENNSGGKLTAYVVALAEDADGELYVLTNGRNSLTGKTGKIFKVQ